MGFKKVRLCECCGQILFNHKSNRKFCKNCSTHIYKLKQKFYQQIFKLKKFYGVRSSAKTKILG